MTKNKRVFKTKEVEELLKSLLEAQQALDFLLSPEGNTNKTEFLKALFTLKERANYIWHVSEFRLGEQFDITININPISKKDGTE